MRFLSGSRARKVTYVIEPSRPVMDMTTGRTTVTPALRAKFEDHRFDSKNTEGLHVYAQATLQPGQKLQERIEEVQKQVEEYLLNHQDFARSDGRGIFLDNTATVSESEIRAKGVRRRCIFMQDVGEDTVQCNEYVDDPESDYCQTHEAIIAAAVGGPR